MIIPDPDGIVRRAAYFSMEIALEPDIPTYSGGLGVLAGDTLRSAADLHVPMVGVTLAHRKGYFRQILDHVGNQSESPMPWDPAAHAELMDATASVVIEGRHVRVRAWRYWIKGVGTHDVPVYLLDTDCPENSDWDRRLTDSLYRGTQTARALTSLNARRFSIRIDETSAADSSRSNPGPASYRSTLSEKSPAGITAWPNGPRSTPAQFSSNCTTLFRCA